ASGKCKGFRESLHFEGEKGVHGQLNGLAGAVRTEVEPLFAHDGEGRFGSLKRLGVAADHENQVALFRAPSAAGDGRIQKMDARARRSSGDFLREGRRDGAGVNVESAALEPGEGTIVFSVTAPEDFFKSGRITDDGDEDVGRSRGFAGRRDKPGSGCNEGFGAGRCAIPDRKRKTRFEKIHPHGTAHEAEAD